jgi:hypothetical protein
MRRAVALGCSVRALRARDIALVSGKMVKK